ncbi:DUF3263 domain-containing protein [Nocardioides sp. T2.26MG-1]|uniref:DUF3263 domain-containing protein n=1 Tax=Nocardioides sp. T2.26MG-1 TaxID=3041166 RepID=UPI0031451C50
MPKSDKSGAELSDVEHAMLAFEQKWWKYAGAKETAVREEFDMPMTRYYQVLNVLIDRPAALAAEQLTVGRLRRLRLRGRRSRRRTSVGRNRREDELAAAAPTSAKTCTAHRRTFYGRAVVLSPCA